MRGWVRWWSSPHDSAFHLLSPGKGPSLESKAPSPCKGTHHYHYYYYYYQCYFHYHYYQCYFYYYYYYCYSISTTTTTNETTSTAKHAVKPKKNWYTSRFVRVILAQGPC